MLCRVMCRVLLPEVALAEHHLTRETLSHVSLVDVTQRDASSRSLETQLVVDHARVDVEHVSRQVALRLSARTAHARPLDALRARWQAVGDMMISTFVLR